MTTSGIYSTGTDYNSFVIQVENPAASSSSTIVGEIYSPNSCDSSQSLTGRVKNISGKDKEYTACFLYIVGGIFALGVVSFIIYFVVSPSGPKGVVPEK